MIILLKDIFINKNEKTFISFIKSQVISLYNELTYCIDLPDDVFLNVVNKSNIFVKINNNYRIKGIITIFIESKIIHNAMCVAHIEDLVIKKEFRSKGIGKELLKYAMNYAKNNNCYKVILNCSDDLKEFYKKNGFDCKNNEMSVYF